CVRSVRNRRIDRLVGSDQQKESRIGTAFVELSGGMEVARPIADRRGDMQPIPHQSSDHVKLLIDVRLFGEIRQQRHIISDARLLKKTSQHLGCGASSLASVERQGSFYDRR